MSAFTHQQALKNLNAKQKVATRSQDGNNDGLAIRGQSVGKRHSASIDTGDWERMPTQPDLLKTRSLKYNKEYLTKMMTDDTEMTTKMHPNYDSKTLLTNLRNAVASRCGASRTPMQLRWRYLNKKGKPSGVNFQEFMEVLHDVNLHIPRRNAREIFDELDMNQDGKISWKEFARRFEQPDFDKDCYLSKFSGYESTKCFPSRPHTTQPRKRPQSKSKNDANRPCTTVPRRRSRRRTPKRMRRSKTSALPLKVHHGLKSGLKYNQTFLENQRPTIDTRLHQNFNAENALEIIREALLTKCGAGQHPTMTYWKFFNRDHRGGVIFEEFVEALHDLNLFYPKADVQKLFNEIDTDQNGHIDWKEFCSKFYRKDYTGEGKASTVSLARDDVDIIRAKAKRKWDRKMKRCQSARSIRPWADRT